LTWRSSVKVYTDIANRAYPVDPVETSYEPYNGIAFNVQSLDQDSSRRTWDYLTAITRYRPWDNTGICAGLDYLRFGPSYRNPLAFRGDQSNYRPWLDTAHSTMRISQTAPMLFVGFDMELNWVRYEQYTGKLAHSKDLDKYFHTHRLEFNLPMHSQVAVQETEIYGSTVEAAGSNPNLDADSSGRSLEWLYVMPFLPYYFASHYNGDRDNGVISIDGSFGGIPHWTFYGELLLDDSKSPLSLFDDSWWGNKWAFSGGWSWVAQHGPWHWEWRAEYTRIEPWVYTHDQGAAYSYTHYGQCLGSDLGPNSQELYTHAQIARGQASLRLSLSSVAKDTSRSGNINSIHDYDLDGTTRDYLNPETTIRYKEIGLEISYAPWNFLWFRLVGYRYSGDYDGWRGESAIGVTW
ncbi:MAG TPA: hypothetical protein VLM37_00290, partial [Fibrobacteraceae bacterium]|nr:hypothetical protein [Fibrobacteraceae bacterium]